MSLKENTFTVKAQNEGLGDIFANRAEEDVSNAKLFVVSGRVSGNDDDTQFTVEANSEGEAGTIFIKQLQHESGGDEGTDILVISTSQLSTSINERKKRQ